LRERSHAFSWDGKSCGSFDLHQDKNNRKMRWRAHFFNLAIYLYYSTTPNRLFHLHTDIKSTIQNREKRQFPMPVNASQLIFDMTAYRSTLLYLPETKLFNQSSFFKNDHQSNTNPTFC
jgi:hypothetical protein